MEKIAKRKSHLRRRTSNESDSDTETICTKLEETKELQGLRRRPNGISVIGLALGTKVPLEDEVLAKDPFKVKSGGMVNMQALKTGKIKQSDDAYDTGIGTQFSVETNKRDEDEEMLKYIEEQLAKRKGSQAGDSDDFKQAKYLSPEEAALQAVPNHLRESSATKNEEMLSNQMLSGIPEVDLGIEAKIKNIEATEEAKLKLMYKQNSSQDAPSQFVPTNMAVNFTQHSQSKFDSKMTNNADGTAASKKKRKPECHKEEAGKSNKKLEKATDDYHYEKFKKQFRRY